MGRKTTLNKPFVVVAVKELGRYVTEVAARRVSEAARGMKFQVDTTMVVKLPSEKVPRRKKS